MEEERRQQERVEESTKQEEETRREHRHASSKRSNDDKVSAPAHPAGSTRSSHRDRPEGRDREKEDSRHATSSSKVQAHDLHSSRPTKSGKASRHSEVQEASRIPASSKATRHPEDAAASRGGSATDTRPDYRALLIDLYKLHRPERVPEVDRIIQKYNGTEAELYAHTCKKYGVKDSQADPPAAKPAISLFREPEDPQPPQPSKTHSQLSRDGKKEATKQESRASSSVGAARAAGAEAHRGEEEDLLKRFNGLREAMPPKREPKRDRRRDRAEGSQGGAERHTIKEAASSGNYNGNGKADRSRSRERRASSRQQAAASDLQERFDKLKR